MTDGDDDTPTSSPARPGVPRGTLVRIGDHDVTGVLGRGGFGVVYAAVHRELGHRRAIKVLAAELAGDDEMVKRFAREARVVNLVDHPSIIQTLDVGRLPDGRPYFVMPHVDAVGLHELIAASGALPLADVVAILAPVCDALAAAHAAGVVHRDLKAANVLVAGEGAARRVWVADFGIAKLLDPVPGSTALTVGGQRLGTPECMAPEQVLGGEIDARADVYALGVLVFHMATGRYPFSDADPGEVERMHVSAPVPQASAIAPAAAPVDAVIARAMAKRPGRRYPDPGSLFAALAAAVAGTGEAGASAPTPGDGSATPTRRVHGDRPLVVIVVRMTGAPVALDADELARAAPGSEVRIRGVRDDAITCLVRTGGDRRALAEAAAAVARAMRRAAPTAPIAVWLAADDHALHSAYNAANHAPAGSGGAIALDPALAEALGPDDAGAIVRAGDLVWLAPESPA